jgi:hypothetical protein
MDLRCHGGTWEDNERSIKPRVFGFLLDVAGPFVKNYRLDFYHDALIIEEALVPNKVFYYSWDRDGTSFGQDPVVGLNRYLPDEEPINGFSFYVAQDDKGSWHLVTSVQEEDMRPLPEAGFDATIEVVENETGHVTRRQRAIRNDADEMAKQMADYVDPERFHLRIVWH